MSQEEAFRILATPLEKLQLGSDYYKAVFHLAKYPGSETEKTLLALLKTVDTQQPFKIARRKAVEVLARLGCIEAIPVIGECLDSSDPYLVENAAWALQELDCREHELHKKMIKLLDDPEQNRRVLIQSLAKLEVSSSIARIQSLLQDESVSKGVRGASISALLRLCGESTLITELQKNLFVSNQNGRYCAVQDAINSKKIELLPSVLKSPVAPFFRMMAVSSLWPEGVQTLNGFDLIEVLDALINDDPNELELVHCYEEQPAIGFLIEELFNTDFSRSYLALKTIIDRKSIHIWPLAEQVLERVKKDYGALYFFITMFRMIPCWGVEEEKIIESLSIFALDNRWPSFMKFRPAAILSLMNISPKDCLNYAHDWLDSNKTPFWACRYAALMSIYPMLEASHSKPLIDRLDSAQKDPHRFVRAKATSIDI